MPKLQIDGLDIADISPDLGRKLMTIVRASDGRGRVEAEVQIDVNSASEVICSEPVRGHHKVVTEEDNVAATVSFKFFFKRAWRRSIHVDDL